MKRVIETDPRKDQRWEEFLAKHQGACIYHHPAWFEVLERTYAYRPLGLAYEQEGGGFSGVLPLYFTRSVLRGHRLSSLPHTPLAGPVAEDDEATAALVLAAVDHTRATRASQLQLKTLTPDLHKLVDCLTVLPWDDTYVLELPDARSSLRFGSSRNHSRIRSSINRSRRLGINVREAESKGDVWEWYHLYLETMRAHVVPPRPRRFFESLWEVLRPRGLMSLLLAERSCPSGRRLAAGSIFLRYGSTVFYAFNGRRREDLWLRGNDAIQWAAIEDAHRRGFRRFDFGEVSDSNKLLADFKRKWGSEPRRLYRYYYPFSRELERGVLAHGTRLRGTVNAAWRQLPLTATEIIGRLLYRYL